MGSLATYSYIGGTAGNTHSFPYSVGYIIPFYNPATSCIYEAASWAGSGFPKYTDP